MGKRKLEKMLREQEELEAEEAERWARIGGKGKDVLKQFATQPHALSFSPAAASSSFFFFFECFFGIAASKGRSRCIQRSILVTFWSSACEKRCGHRAVLRVSRVLASPRVEFKGGESTEHAATGGGWCSWTRGKHRARNDSRRLGRLGSSHTTSSSTDIRPKARPPEASAWFGAST